MPTPAERLGVLEERADNLDEKFGAVVTNIKSIADDVGEMKEMLARHQGAAQAIKYITHGLAGIGGALIGLFSYKH